VQSVQVAVVYFKGVSDARRQAVYQLRPGLESKAASGSYVYRGTVFTSPTALVERLKVELASSEFNRT
jgi:hypothetical protein